MTGRFSFEPETHQRMRFDFSDGTQLYFIDPRKFARMQLIKTLNELTSRLGPDALTLTLPKLHQIMKTKRQLKPLLLDQSKIAGLGNIYVDEALWLAGLHPQRPAIDVAASDVCSLHRSIHTVLKQGIKNGGASLGHGKGNFSNVYGQAGVNRDHFKVYQRTLTPCLTCHTPIERTVIGQRSTHFCPRCQPI